MKLTPYSPTGAEGAVSFLAALVAPRPGSRAAANVAAAEDADRAAAWTPERHARAARACAATARRCWRDGDGDAAAEQGFAARWHHQQSRTGGRRS